MNFIDCVAIPKKNKMGQWKNPKSKYAIKINRGFY